VLQETVEFKINTTGRQWICFMCAAYVPTHKSTQSTYPVSMIDFFTPD